MTAREIKEVVDKGLFYCPAWGHYGYETNVQCDNCNTDKLDSCLAIREGNIDVCLKCAKKIKSSSSSHSSSSRAPTAERLTYMRESKFAKERSSSGSSSSSSSDSDSDSAKKPKKPRTRMRQFMFASKKSEPRTKMFKENNEKT